MNRKGLFFIIAMILFIVSRGIADDVRRELVGQWDFETGTGEDLSGNGYTASLGDVEIVDLGNGHLCAKVLPETNPIRIGVAENSKLSIREGTVAFWVNLCDEDGYPYFIDYNNNAIQIRSYRRYLQPRFQGEGEFKFSSNVLGQDWTNFLVREDAFYPLSKANLGEAEWHHFAVSYDLANKQITGWRDGQLIAIADLSTAHMEPLKTKKLTEILIAQHFAGFIDDIRIYNTVLTDTEVNEMYNAKQTIYTSRNDFIPNDRKLMVYEYQQADEILYNAWLQYAPQIKKESIKFFKRLIAPGENITVQTAGAELTEAIKGMMNIALPSAPGPEKDGNILLGTPHTSELIKSMASKLGLNRVNHDGFVLKTVKHQGKSYLVVAANQPAGVIFGVFNLIRRMKLGQNIDVLDIVENPGVEIRMVNHWDFFRGFKGDDWQGKKINVFNYESNRYNSIYSWEDLRNGNTKLINDWARLLASANWNGICPTEINWEFRNNYLEHLPEVKILGDILRSYGIKLYWSPNYLLALEKSTADSLYKYVPDFGGYLLKLGSEAQLGNPFPEMVNKIADNLLPYGGKALVRGFVYGKYRYAHFTEVYRNTMPYDIFVPNDGNYRENVVIVGKANPLDWDFAAPISPLDGAIQKNDYGTEMVIAKGWPLSWVEKWKWWMDSDNYRHGPGSYNKDAIKCLLGVAMISPSPAWTSCPLNMVNYYGIGRLGWNPDLSVDQIYSEYIGLTYGGDPEVNEKIKKILFLSDDITRNLYMYRGYRGVWFDSSEDDLVENKTPHTMNQEGIGIINAEAQQKVLNQYAPGLREIFNDLVKSEDFLPYFNFVKYDYLLSNGKTIIQDMYDNLDDAVEGAKKMVSIWDELQGKIDAVRFIYVRNNLENFVDTAEKTRLKMIKIIEKISGRPYDKIYE